MIEQKSFSGWAHITRAEDVPNCWVGHCLDFNIMSIGESPQHALGMVREAVGIALADDLNHGRDPHARRADSQDWEPLVRLFEKHTKIPISQMDTQGQGFKEFAAQITVVLTKLQREDGVAPNVDLDIDGSDVLSAA